jgi:ATP adenylyltransferase
LQTLWAPWRRQYVQAGKPDGCAFCAKLGCGRDSDASELVLHRGTHCAVLLNIYPYSPGHLLVCPARHISALGDLRAEEWAESGRLLAACEAAVSAAMRPQGLNVGLNLGAAAGAGIVDHLHWHLVPRWFGDHNFITLLADARVISQANEEVFGLLQPALSAALSG